MGVGECRSDEVVPSFRWMYMYNLYRVLTALTVESLGAMVTAVRSFSGWLLTSVRGFSKSLFFSESFSLTAVRGFSESFSMAADSVKLNVVPKV